MERTTQKLVKKSIAAEVLYRLRMGQDLSLAEISKAIRSRHRGIDKLADQRLEFCKAAEEALRRKAHS